MTKVSVYVPALRPAVWNTTFSEEGVTAAVTLPKSQNAVVSSVRLVMVTGPPVPDAVKLTVFVMSGPFTIELTVSDAGVATRVDVTAWAEGPNTRRARRGKTRIGDPD